jgi:hypothetical protein
MSFFSRLKRRFSRGWYWLIGLTFLATTLSAAWVSYKMLSVWFRDG